MPGGIGNLGSDDFHAAGGVGDDHVVADGFKSQPYRQGFPAADAGAVPRGEFFHLLDEPGYIDRIIFHYSLTP